MDNVLFGFSCLCLRSLVFFIYEQVRCSDDETDALLCMVQVPRSATPEGVSKNGFERKNIILSASINLYDIMILFNLRYLYIKSVVEHVVH